MKKIFFGFFAICSIAFAACGSRGSKNEPGEHDITRMNKNTTRRATDTDDNELKVITATYSNAGINTPASIKAIVGHYLHIKNALANDNGSEAASGAIAMGRAISKIDKSLLTVDQKKVYDVIEEGLKVHAGDIGKGADKIKAQRSHFSKMSEDVYGLAKAFGGGRSLYHGHCPMYNENKGAMWLSEVKEIRNPYYGAGMPGCGSVEEVIK